MRPSGDGLSRYDQHRGDYQGQARAGGDPRWSGCSSDCFVWWFWDLDDEVDVEDMRGRLEEVELRRLPFRVQRSLSGARSRMRVRALRVVRVVVEESA